MKKMISILGSASLFATSLSTLAFGTNNKNKYSNITQRNIKISFKNKIERLILINNDNNHITFENIIKIQNNSVIFDESSIQFQSLNYESKNILRSFEKNELDIVYLNYKIYKELQKKNINNINQRMDTSYGQIEVEQPRNVWEYLGGVWRLHFDHQFSEALAYGVIPIAELIAVLALILIIIPPAAAIAATVAAFLFASREIIKTIDHGNGILVRFAVWIIPNDIQPTNWKWN